MNEDRGQTSILFRAAYLDFCGHLLSSFPFPFAPCSLKTCLETILATQPWPKCHFTMAKELRPIQPLPFAHLSHLLPTCPPSEFGITRRFAYKFEHDRNCCNLRWQRNLAWKKANVGISLHHFWGMNTGLSLCLKNIGRYRRLAKESWLYFNVTQPAFENALVPYHRHMRLFKWKILNMGGVKNYGSDRGNLATFDLDLVYDTLNYALMDMLLGKWGQLLQAFLGLNSSVEFPSQAYSIPCRWIISSRRTQTITSWRSSRAKWEKYLQTGYKLADYPDKQWVWIKREKNNVLIGRRIIVSYMTDVTMTM